MSDSLPPELQQFIDQELASGRYQSVQDVIRDGLQLLRQRRLHELRHQIDVGLDQLDRGEGIELDDDESLRAFFDEIKRRGRKEREVERVIEDSRQ